MMYNKHYNVISTASPIFRGVHQSKYHRDVSTEINFTHPEESATHVVKSIFFKITVAFMLFFPLFILCSFVFYVIFFTGLQKSLSAPLIYRTHVQSTAIFLE